MSQVLSTAASDTVSVVGLSVPASCVTIRCAPDNFQETRSIDQGGEWLVGVPVMLPESSSGYVQLVGMAVMAITECVVGLPAEDICEMPPLPGVAEVDRPGRLAGLEQPLPQVTEERLGYYLHERSCVIPRGRVSVVVALLNMCRPIGQGCSKVLIAGVDSYLTVATLMTYQERGRLLGSYCQDGFTPGEGTATVLVTVVCASEEPQLLCLGLGFRVEKAIVESEGLPLRADGLTQAVKAAFADRGFGYELVDYRLADLSGEQYYFGEAALALSRTLRVRRERVELWGPAGRIGECGAMTGPALLYIALVTSHKGHAHGPQVFCHSGNDAGEQAAAVLGCQRVRANQMANEVYANDRELFYESASRKPITLLSDVCFTPPQASPTPLGAPVPYPNTGMSKDTARGSRTVRITHKKVMLKNKSHFEKSYGDEAGRAPEKGTTTSINTGKAYFTSWSMDVKTEGLNVVRRLDLITYNHNPSPGNIATWPYTSKMKAAFKPGGERASMEHLHPQPHSRACPSTVGGGAQTSHHLIPGRYIRGKVGYSHSKAPVIYVSHGNQHQGSHKRCHAKFDPVGLDHFDKGKPLKYETACNTVVASAGGALSPPCELTKKEKECVAFQLDQYYKAKPKKEPGCTTATNLRVSGVARKVIPPVRFASAPVGRPQELNHDKERDHPLLHQHHCDWASGGAARQAPLSGGHGTRRNPGDDG